MKPPRSRWLARLTLLIACSLPVAAFPAETVTVEVEGIEGELLDNVRGYLGIVQHEYPEEGELDPALVRRLHARAPREARNALKPFGYYEARVRGEVERTDAGWRAVYSIDPGPRVRLTEVTIRLQGDAADDPAFRELRAELPLAVDQPLVHADYETAKRRLMELAARRGYIDARWVRNRLRIDVGAQSAVAELVLDSGPRYRFGEVEFSDSPLDRDFLRRYLRFRPGDPFLTDRLLDLQYALDDSGYFRRVDVRARRDLASDGRIPIVVGLEARPKHRYSFGIGYGTDTGARFSIGRETRYANRRGHRLDAELELAEIRTSFAARYTIPLEQPWRERLELIGGLQQEDFGDGESEQYSVEARRITTSAGWQRTLSLKYERSRDTLEEVIDGRDLVMPGIGLIRSRFDDTIYATRGYRLTLDVNGGSETLGSDVSFLRVQVGARGLRRVWPGGRIIGRIDVGRTRVDDFDDLPLSQRFYAGGDQSVRGFDYQSLGPRDEDGRVIGGQYLAVGSLELEQLIHGNWGAAVFVDAGNALVDPSSDLRESAGVGLRYRSPVGVFRVDVAKAIDGDESPRLHLSLGVDL